MKNQIQLGDTFDHAVLSGETPITAGDVVIEGNLVGIAATSGTYTSSTVYDTIAVNRKGVYKLPLTDSLAVTKGDKVYFNTTTKKVTKTATDVYLGVAYASQDAGTDVTANVLLERDGMAPQAALVAALTDNSGGASANGTIEAITSGTPADLAAQGVINGLIANAIKELATKQNAVLTALKDAGLMASS